MTIPTGRRTNTYGPHPVMNLRGTDCNGKRMWTTVEVLEPMPTNGGMVTVKGFGWTGPVVVSATRLEPVA